MPTDNVAETTSTTAPPSPVATPEKVAPAAPVAIETATPTPGTALGEVTQPTKPAEGEPGKPAKAAESDIVLQFPDGVTVDKELVDKFVPLAKELGLKKEQAQKLADMYVERIQKQGSETTEAWKEQQKSWAEANRKELGKSYDSDVALARQAIAKFGGDALRKEIDALGVGDNPALLKAFVAIGKAVSDDKVAIGQPPITNNEDSIQRKLYPTMFNADGTKKT